MKITKFEDAIVWQKGKDLAIQIYRTLSPVKDFGFKDQICRATVSISNNIAEGLDRCSDKELKMYLYIAKGSCAEVRSMLHIALDLQYITSEEHTMLQQITLEISYMLSSFIKSIKKFFTFRLFDYNHDSTETHS